MANLGATFDASQVEPQTDFSPIPAGDYVAMIIDSDMKPTRNGAGEYLELTLQVIDGQYANRLLWDRLTLRHQNTKTVEIAQRKLSAICHAIGVLTVSDSAQLHNRPMVVRVKYAEDQQYGPKNEIGSYKPTGQPMQAHPAPRTAPAPAPAPAPAQSAMPWNQPQQAAPPAQAARQQPAAGSAPPWAARK